MLDIRRIRQEQEAVQLALRRREKDYSREIDAILELDTQRRSLCTKSDQLKTEQKAISKQVPRLEQAKSETTEIRSKLREVGQQIADYDHKITEIETKQLEIMLILPNLPQAEVPDGKDEEQNKVCRSWGQPKDFPYEPKPHWEIGHDLGLLEPDRAGKVTAKRFHFFRGLGARLSRAVTNFYLDQHTARGYEELQPPYLANAASLQGTGQLPPFAEDMFRVEKNGLYLIPTAEVPVTNYHRGEILDGGKLPIRYCAYSECFRAETVSAGRDTRGLIRQQQFGKVELVAFSKPEESGQELERLTRDAEHCLQSLGLPYRVVCLCAGDLGFASAKTYDIEVWMPSYRRYVEISSCSNCEDFQARRMAIRYKDQPGEKARLVHTLNGSGLAVGRTVAAVLENYQNDDGSVTVPDVLRPYMGVDRIY